MDELGHYVRVHLTGSASGIELFERGQHLHDPAARSVVATIHGELCDERLQQLRMADDLGIRLAPCGTMGAVVGERIGRLKPNGHLLKRTLLTDVVDLEAMRVALSGKLAGWEALLAVADQHDGLRVAELEQLRDQALRQLAEVSLLHAQAAARALGRGSR